MELVHTTPQLAFSILEKGNRKIVANQKKIVQWINLNNQTCFVVDGLNGLTCDNENVDFFIQVPANAKTVY